MTGRERLAAARRALHDIDNERALRANPLLAHLTSEIAFDRVRAHVLRALEGLDPGARGDVKNERLRRLHTILLRCDVQRVPHKSVAATLGLSRRQFYRDRHAALSAFAEALICAPSSLVVEPNGIDVRLLYIETLRERGRYEAVWRESMRALREMKGHPREIEVWTVAAEAARFFGNARKSFEAIEAMRRAAQESPHEQLRRASLLRIAICEIAIDWMQADFQGARTRIERAIDACGDERTMHGRDATLFGILLNYATNIAFDAGNWDAAAEFIRRWERILERSEVLHSAANVHRLRARLAMHRDGDALRAAVELRDALHISTMHKALAPLAASAVELGVALAAADPSNASEYVDYGLAIGHDACGYDDFAVLYTTAIPHLIQHHGAEWAIEGLDDIRSRSPLFRRADLYARLAESSILIESGKSEQAAVASAELARELERMSFYPAAAEAHVISASALARERRVVAARRSLTRARELIETYGIASTRRNASALGTSLALPHGALETITRT